MWQKTLSTDFGLTSTQFLEKQTENQGDLLFIWHRNKVICERLFACKSIKFSMTGTPSCLLQQQPKIFDLHFLGYMQKRGNLSQAKKSQHPN